MRQSIEKFGNGTVCGYKEIEYDFFGYYEY